MYYWSHIVIEAMLSTLTVRRYCNCTQTSPVLDGVAASTSQGEGRAAIINSWPHGGHCHTNKDEAREDVSIYGQYVSYVPQD